METEIIIHNSVSLDGSLTGFIPDMGVHYSIAGSYIHDARLIGSETVISGKKLDPHDNGIVWMVYEVENKITQK